MPDHRPDPADDARAAWRDAFAALPQDTPPADGWARVAAALPASPAPRVRPRRVPLHWLAAAAVLALAVALPWQAGRDGAPDTSRGDATATVDAGGATDPGLDALYAESARLEVLLAHARDGAVGSAGALAVSSELEARVAAVDAELAAPDLSTERRRALWRDRVDALESLVVFEGNRRWLAANGTQYDPALVQVN